MRKDILNHRDISYILFFNHDSVYFLINVYLDSFQVALKYLKNTEINISNVLIMIGNFNIRDNSWDPNFSHHSHHSNVLFKIADFFQLELSRPTKQVPTRYLDNQQDSNLVINLMFLRLGSLKHNNHTIHPQLEADLRPHSPHSQYLNF